MDVTYTSSGPAPAAVQLAVNELARLRHNRICGIREAWLAVLSLVPWMVLTLTSGGTHSHPVGLSAVAVTAGSAVPAAVIPGEAPRLQGNDVAARDTACTACLWQLHASGSLPHPPATRAVLPAAPGISPGPAYVSASDSRSFDPRAPPLS